MEAYFFGSSTPTTSATSAIAGEDAGEQHRVPRQLLAHHRHQLVAADGAWPCDGACHSQRT